MEHRRSGLGFTEFSGSYIEGIDRPKIEVEILQRALTHSRKIFLQIVGKCGILINEKNKKLKTVF